MLANTQKESGEIFLILLSKPKTRPKLPLLQIALPAPHSTTPCWPISPSLSVTHPILKKQHNDFITQTPEDGDS